MSILKKYNIAFERLGKQDPRYHHCRFPTPTLILHTKEKPLPEIAMRRYPSALGLND